MTPLAARVANELTLPKAKRIFDDHAGVLDLLDQDMHCFEVSALTKSVNAVLDDPIAAEDVDESWSVWRDIGSMLPNMFLPSPVTWLEQTFNGKRIACVIREVGDYFSLSLCQQSKRGPFSLQLCRFRHRGILEDGERIEVLPECEPENDPDDGKDFNSRNIFDPDKLDVTKATQKDVVDALRAREMIDARIGALNRQIEIAETAMETVQMLHRFIGMTVLTLDLINTPGLIGLKQRDPHRGLAKRLSALGVGRYPLRAWSEVVLKAETRIAETGERLSGTTHHKCLHFVRSHLRRYQDGHVTVIPAHWRGDPALGIKRTRYRMEMAA